MGKIAKYAFIAWLWINKYGSAIKSRFYSLLMDRLVAKGIFKHKEEVRKEINALSTAVASADVKTASSKAITLFGRSPGTLLKTIWDIAAGGTFVYEVYSVVESMTNDNVPDDHYLVIGNQYLERVHSEGAHVNKSFEEMLAEFEAYADEHTVEAAVSKYLDDPVIGQSLRDNLSPSKCEVNLLDMSREIRIRQAKVRSLCALLGLSHSSTLELLDLLREVKREDFFL